MRIAFFTSLLFLFATVARAQNQSLEHKLHENVISFPADKQPVFVKNEVLLQEGEKMVPTHEVLLKGVTGDEAGTQHFRYQQTINGIPVCGATYIVHVSNGHVLHENGRFAPNNLAGQLPKQPSLKPEQAISLATQHINASRYKWQEAGQDQDYTPTAELVYYAPARDFEELRLTYKTDIYALVPLSHDFVYIDAITGEVLGKENRICTIKRMGNYLSDSLDLGIYCTQPSPSCYLYEKTGAKEIETRTLNNTTNPTLSSRVAVGDASNTDRSAVDAHWAAERFYDYFLSKFNRKSINDNGILLKSYVHYGNNVFNAMWDGYVAYFGDGDYRNGYKSLTTLDICAHELTHGLVSYSAGLNYYGESGALNEAFADIFGSEVEYEVSRDTLSSWTLGEKMGVTLRSMSNPGRYNQPAYYMGAGWEHGTVDYGGVHINSGVLNYWYYLLVNGARRLADEYDSVNHVSPVARYTFNGISRVKAAKLLYIMLTSYLTENSRYYDAYLFSLKAADEVPLTAAEKASLMSAWTAVGIPRHIPSTDLCPSNVENDNSREMPRPLGQFVRAMIESPGDVDWYRFSAPNNKPNFKIVLDMEATKKNYNMKVYDVTGYTLYKGNTNKKKIKSYTYNMNANGGSYLVSISGVRKTYNPNACYTLTVTTSDRTLTPDDDDSTGNETDDTTESGLLAAGNSMAGNEVQVIPNPATDHITLLFYKKEGTPDEVFIYDPSGRVMLHTACRAEKEGLQQIHISLNNFPPGLYYVKKGGRTVKLIIS